MDSSIAAYHTFEDLTGEKVSIADVLSDLSLIPQGDVLSFVAGTSAILERRGEDSSKQQIRLLNTVTPPEFSERIREALKQLTIPFGALFHRRQLWLLLQIAVLACKRKPVTAQGTADVKQLGVCCLKTNDLLKQIECVKPMPDSAAGKSLSQLMTFLISYVDLHYEAEVIARAWQFWLEMEDDEAVKKFKKQIGLSQSLDEIFEKKYGIPLREFLVFVTILYFTFTDAKNEDDWPTPGIYDSTTNFKRWFAEQHVEAALRLLSTTPDDLANRLLGSSRHSWATDASALVQTPMLEIEPNRFICPDIHMFRAFYMQRIFELLNESMDTGQFRQLVGKLFERYIERLMRSFAPASTVLVNSYYDDVRFVAANGQEACDGLLLWSSLAVFLECKTNLITPRQRYAMSFDETLKAIDDQLATFALPDEGSELQKEKKKERKGIGQLAFNLYKILSGDQINCRGSVIDLSAVPKLYPAVVVYDEGIANYAVRLHLNKKMVDWFDTLSVDHARVGHALLFSIRDMELFEILAHQLGAEKVMVDYIRYVESNPNDPHSMFHDYAYSMYPEAQSSTGLTIETVDRVVTSVRDEMKRRSEQDKS